MIVPKFPGLSTDVPVSDWLVLAEKMGYENLPSVVSYPLCLASPSLRLNTVSASRLQRSRLGQPKPSHFQLSERFRGRKSWRE